MLPGAAAVLEAALPAPRPPYCAASNASAAFRLALLVLAVAGEPALEGGLHELWRGTGDDDEH